MILYFKSIPNSGSFFKVSSEITGWNKFKNNILILFDEMRFSLPSAQIISEYCRSHCSTAAIWSELKDKQSKSVLKNKSNAPLTVCTKHTYTHATQTALADVLWNIQVNQHLITTIILPGNSGRRMLSAALPRLLPPPQRHDPVSAALTHHYEAAKLTKYMGEFEKDEKFQLSLWFFSLLFLNRSCMFPECRLGSQQTVWLQLT